jgi:N-acetylglucosaminyldiphosphoundecaprenol N-acetyl-beta-D-mannosaminyltransferase
VQTINETSLFQQRAIPPRNVVIILGVPIDVLNMKETLDRIESFVRTGRQTGKTHQIATVNADFVVNAIKDPELRYILQETDLATTDGMPIVWGANALGFHLDGRVTGSDLIPLLAERAAEKGFSVYFLGAAPGIAARAAEILKEKNPNLIIAGVSSPPFQPILEMDPDIVENVRKAKPDILLVAFGNPKQEKWIAMHRYELGVPVMIGVGGTLDFITQTSVRAPKWMQKIGLEWLHRLIQDPARLWKRYVTDIFVFISFFFRQLWLMKKTNTYPITLPVSEEIIINGYGLIRASGAITIQNHSSLLERVNQLNRQTSQIIIDLSKVPFMDSTAIGTLVHLTKELRATEGELFLASIPAPILMTIKFLNLDAFFNIQDHWEAVVDPQGNATGTSQPQITRPVNDEQKKIEGIPWQVVKLPLRFDAANVDQVRQKCSPILQSEENLALDCSETTLLTSAGLAVISELYQKTSTSKSKFILTGVSKDVLQVLQMVKFDQFLQIRNSSGSK